MAFISGFAKKMGEFEKSSMDKVNTATRMIALEVFRRVILKTPVETGRARGNWQCSIGVPIVAMNSGDDWLKGDSDAGLKYDKSGSGAIQAAADQVMSWKPGDVAIFLTNNLPYINRLEHGYSNQAPAGMVAITIAEFDGIVARVR